MTMDAALFNALALGALSLALAVNMSRLRNVARAQGDADDEKKFLSGPVFQQVRMAATWRSGQSAARRCAHCACPLLLSSAAAGESLPDARTRARVLAHQSVQASLAQHNTLEYVPLYVALMLHLHHAARAARAPLSHATRYARAPSDDLRCVPCVLVGGACSRA